MNKKINLAEKEYWDSVYKDYKFKELPEDHIIHKWIRSFFTEDNDNSLKSCLEIGAFPGTYLSIFGKLNYKLFGIDQVYSVDSLLVSWLRQKNYNLGGFYQGDFLSWKTEEKYDLVTSFGFVEHFKNYDEIIKLQCNLVKPGGYVVIEAPNFKGFLQYYIRLLVDNKNLKRHYIPSMNLNKWEDILLKENFVIIDKSYLGSFFIWVEDQKRNILQRLILRILKKNRNFLEKIFKKNSIHYSPYMGIIAQKKE